MRRSRRSDRARPGRCPFDLGSGAYAFRCLLEDTDPGREYHAYAAAGPNVLARQARKLDADVRACRLAAARAAWLPAHLTYERLGAAYGTFGNFDTEIDGRPDRLTGGVSSPQSPASTGWNTACGIGRALTS